VQERALRHVRRGRLILFDVKGLPFLEPKPETWMKDLAVGRSQRRV
jgi:hypothetical protein